jgi:hypothetical protein
MIAGSSYGLLLGGDKTIVFLIIFLALPAGSIIGIVFADKKLLKSKMIGRSGFVLAALLSFMGGIESIIILEEVGGKGIIFAPLISAFLAVAGFSIPHVRKHRNK